MIEQKKRTADLAGTAQMFVRKPLPMGGIRQIAPWLQSSGFLPTETCSTTVAITPILFFCYPVNSMVAEPELESAQSMEVAELGVYICLHLYFIVRRRHA